MLFRSVGLLWIFLLISVAGCKGRSSEDPRSAQDQQSTDPNAPSTDPNAPPANPNTPPTNPNVPPTSPNAPPPQTLGDTAALPPFSITGGVAMPNWNTNSYTGVSLSGTIVGSNNGAIDASKISITANCGGRAGTHNSLASAALNNVVIEIGGLNATLLEECTFWVIYDNMVVQGTINWDVYKLGHRYSPGSLNSSGCSGIKGLIANKRVEPRSRTVNYLLTNSQSNYSNATYIVNTSAYRGGCTIGGKHVVGNARKALPNNKQGLTCWTQSSNSGYLGFPCGNVRNLSAQRYFLDGNFDSSSRLYSIR